MELTTPSSGIFCVLRTYQVSEIRGRGTFNGAVILATLFDVLTQNIAITAANVLPLGTILSSPTLRSLPSLPQTDLEASRPSSPLRSAKSTIFVIEGPRDAETPSRPGSARLRGDSLTGLSTGHLRADSLPRSITGHLRADSLSRPSTSHLRAESLSRPGTALSRLTDRPFTGMSLRPDASGAVRCGTEISAGGPLPSGVDAELLGEGIIRTVEVEVVEESVDDVVGWEVAVGSWRDILREGPL